MLLREFTDRRPVASALILAAILVPGASVVYLGLDLISGGAVNSAMVVFLCVLAIQAALWHWVERPSIIMMPFILGLIGLVACEVIYNVLDASGARADGPVAIVYALSGLLADVFSLEASAAVGGLILHFLYLGARAIWDAVRR